MKRAVALVVLASGIASAQPATDSDKERIAQARTFFVQGNELLDKHLYLQAIVAFEEAYKRTPDARGAVLGLAVALDSQYARDPSDPARLRRAVKLYHEYLNLPDANKRTVAFEALALLEPQLARVEEAEARAAAAAEPPPPAPPPAPPPTALIISASAPNASVAFEGGSPQDAPAVFETTAGKHHVVLSAPGYRSAERDATALEAQTVSMEVPLEELPATLRVHGATGAVAIDGQVVGEVGEPLTVAPGRHRVTVIERGHDAWAHDLDLQHGTPRDVTAELVVSQQRVLSRYAGTGAGAVLVAGAITTIVAYAAQRRAESYNALVGTGTMLTDDERAHYDTAIDHRDAYRTASIVLFSTGLAAGATAALLYFVDTPRIEPGAPPALTPTVGPGAAGVSWQGRF